ncbi:MAG: hypothetical protein ACXVZN_00285 [Gaiellaceae bacterium]
MRRLALATVLVACLAFVAAGCGGKSQPSAVPTNTWANDVCGYLVTWTTTMKSVATSVKSNPTKAGLQDAVTQAEDATKTLSSSIKSLGKPDTPVGDQAKSDISALADELKADVDKIQGSVKGASSVSGAIEAGSVASSTLLTMGQQVSATFADLQKLDAKGELEKAFSSSANCKQLTSGG